MLKRRLIHLLEKLIGQVDALHYSHGHKLQLSPDTRNVYLWLGKDVARKISDRIVSLERHYIRLIVRGKETKTVEFGAKANDIQIDGLSFIEHPSHRSYDQEAV